MTESDAALIGVLAVGTGLWAGFGVFASRAGLLEAFGRKALSWRRLAASAVAAMVPVCGIAACFAAAEAFDARSRPGTLAAWMSAVGWAGWLAYAALLGAQPADHAKKPSRIGRKRPRFPS